MKKLTPRHKRVLLQRSRKRLYNSKKRKGLRHRPYKLQAPQILSLESNFEESLNFLNQIQDNILNSHPKRKIYQFKNTRQIGPCFLVYFLAVLENLTVGQGKGRSHYKIKRQLWDSHLLDLLIHMRFFEGISKKIPKQRCDVPKTVTRIYRGRTDHVLQVEILVDELNSKVRNKLETDDSSLSIDDKILELADVNDILTEAASNACNHAYVDFVPKGVKKIEKYNYWWMFSEYNDEEKQIHFVIADTGKGIAQSIKSDNEYIWHKDFLSNIAESKGWSDLVNNILEKHLYNDSRLIEVAMELGKSRHTVGRGKGFYEIVEKARTLSADLRIFSGSGALKLSGKSSKLDIKELGSGLIKSTK